VKTFVKIEKLDLTAKPNPAPRIIQPNDPRYNIELGCYLRPIEGMIYKAIDHSFGYPCVAKGLNADGVGSLIHNIWKQFVDPVCVGIDMKRFDQHTSRQALEFEHSFYNSLYHDTKLKMLLSWQLVTKGRVLTPDGYTFYKIEGIRTSGAYNTAMGNVIIMTAMIKSYIDFKRSQGIRIDCFDAGDDAGLVCERSNLPYLEDMVDYFLQFGYTLERDEPVYEIEKISFCQTSPIYVNGHYRMVRNVKTALSKDSMYIVPLDEEDWHARRLAIAECGLALAGDVPIFGSFYRCLARGASSRRLKYQIEVCGLYRFSQGMSRQDEFVSDETRVSFYKAFGITPDRQRAIETEYDQMQLTYNTPIHCHTSPFPLFNIAL
jgi:hypothetical protein